MNFSAQVTSCSFCYEANLAIMVKESIGNQLDQASLVAAESDSGQCQQFYIASLNSPFKV